MSHDQVKYVGFPWYRKKNYKRLMKIFADSHLLHDSYEEWLDAAEKAFQSLVGQGLVVEKVDIDPVTFPAWCKARGLDIDSKARVEFANAVVAGKYVKK